MADNYLEYRREEIEKRKAKREKARKARLRKYLEKYRRELSKRVDK